MTEAYVLKQMVSLTHTPFQIVNRDGSVELGVGMRNVERLFYEKNHQMIAVARERAREYPVIFAEKRLLFAVFPEDPVTGQIGGVQSFVEGAADRSAPGMEDGKNRLSATCNEHQKNGFDDASAALAEHRCYDERG